MKIILDKWVALQLVWDESFDGNLEPEIKSRIVCVKRQMTTFECFYGVTILQLVLRGSDSLSKTLRKSSLTSCQGKEIADLTLQTINSLLSKSKFEILLQKMVQQEAVLEIPQSSLPLKRKRPANVLMRTTCLYTMRFWV